jgi:hypothetical protein
VFSLLLFHKKLPYFSLYLPSLDAVALFYALPLNRRKIDETLTKAHKNLDFFVKTGDSCARHGEECERN